VSVSIAGNPEKGDSHNWIEREKIRAGWIYAGDGIEQLERFKKQGMNTLVISAANPSIFGTWARESRRVGMHLFGVIGFSADAKKMGVRQAVFGNGYQSVVACPTDEIFWQKHLILTAVELAKESLAAEKEISGVLVDFELYANADAGQRYYTDACYCDHCYGGFLRQKAFEDMSGRTPFAERAGWLRGKGLHEEYQLSLQRQVRGFASRMREAVNAVRKDFFLGFYPVPNDWMLIGAAKGFGSLEHPMILWSTDTYQGGGPKNVPDDWRAEMERQGIFCYYCAGFLLRKYSAANLAANLYLSSLKADGYWLFAVRMLRISEEKQSGGYYLAAGTPEEYLAAIRRTNNELDTYGANTGHRTALAFVQEPIRYRLTGYDANRFKIPALKDNSEVGAPVVLPAMPLIGSQVVVMDLRPRREASFRFGVSTGKSGDTWGVSYVVLDPDKTMIAEGKMPPGGEASVKFTAAKAGIYAIVLTPGDYGRCVIKESSVPFALATESSLEVAIPGGKMFFMVPAGVEVFNVSAKCKWGAGTATLTVYAPDGSVVLEHETDPYLHKTTLSVPTIGQAGRIWAVGVTAPAKKSFSSVFVTFDERLPPAVTLVPNYVFVKSN
jgi:hypothetical protein